LRRYAGAAPVWSAVARSLWAALLAHPGRLGLHDQVLHAARADGVSPPLLDAVGWCESVWLQRAVSSTGAIGVCQIEPQTARYANIAMAAARLHQLVLQANGNAHLAMGAYVQRISSIARRGMLPETRALEHGP